MLIESVSRVDSCTASLVFAVVSGKRHRRPRSRRRRRRSAPSADSRRWRRRSWRPRVREEDEAKLALMPNTPVKPAGMRIVPPRSERSPGFAGPAADAARSAPDEPRGACWVPGIARGPVRAQSVIPFATQFRGGGRRRGRRAALAVGDGYARCVFLAMDRRHRRSASLSASRPWSDQVLDRHRVKRHRAGAFFGGSDMCPLYGEGAPLQRAGGGSNALMSGVQSRRSSRNTACVASTGADVGSRDSLEQVVGGGVDRSSSTDRRYSGVTGSARNMRTRRRATRCRQRAHLERDAALATAAAGALIAVGTHQGSATLLFARAIR